MSSANPPIVRCASCNRILPEPANLTPEERKPCSWCGAMNRIFEVGLTAGATAQVGRGGGIAGGFAPEVSVPVAPAPAEADTEEARKLQAAGFKLDWERLSDGGAWMLRVYVADDLVDMAVHDDPETVLLAVADRLLPGSQ